MESDQSRNKCVVEADGPMANKFLDPDEFRRQGHMVIDFLADYYANIGKYPVLSQVQPGYLSKCLPGSAPQDPEPIETILADVKKFIVPGLTHWESPNFFAYFPSCVSVASTLGETLSAGFNSVGFSWVSSPAATELENLVMNWLGQMLGLPQHFLFSSSGGGVIHGNTGEAMVCTLITARDKVLAEMGHNSLSKLVVYCSDQTHCSFQKAARTVGIDRNKVRALRTTRETEFGLSPVLLRETIQADLESGLIPLYLCATIGTTPTTAIDPLLPLCKIANEYGIWVHVDAAYAGAALICPEYRELVNGIELVESFSFNAHKWLPFAPNCCCLWVKDRLMFAKSLSTDAEYLRNVPSDSKQVIDYKDWQISLSRRFKSLKLWLVLRSYGVDNLRNHIRNHVQLARVFEELIKQDKRFKVVCPRNFALVCFRFAPPIIKKANGHVVANGNLASVGNAIENGHVAADDNVPSEGHSAEDDHTKDVLEEEEIDKMNQKLLQSINASGRIFITHSMIEGRFVLRFAVGAPMVKEDNIIMAWKVVQEHANRLLGN